MGTALQTNDYKLNLDPPGVENLLLTQAFIDESVEWYKLNVFPVLRPTPKVPTLTSWAVESGFVGDMAADQAMSYITELLITANNHGIEISKKKRELLNQPANAYN